MSEYIYEPHGPWVKLGRTGFDYCRGCGLVGLKNEITRWSTKKGCFHDYHPQYKNKLKELT